MQVTETLSDGLKRSYAVVVPASDLESQAGKKLADIGKTLRLPGFRPGKVPMNLVRQRFGTGVMAEVMQDALNGAADQVIQERGLRPAGQPRIALQGDPKPDAKAAQDLQFNVELELLPEIALPDLGSIALTRLRAEPAEELVEKALASIAEQNRSLADIEEDRASANGDVLTVDFTGRMDGVEFEGGRGTDATVTVGGGGFIPGFTEQLEGLRAGEERTVEVTFPAEYGDAELAGKTAQFEIAVKKLQTGTAAALDDALATKIGFGDFAELRGAVIGQMQREYDGLSRLRIKRELLDALAERADFPSPQGLLEAEFNAIWQRVEADQKAGQTDEEDQGKDPETLRAEYRAIADRRVRLGLLLSEIGRANNVQVSQAELTQALRQEASRYPGQELKVFEFFKTTPGAIEQLRGPLFEDKVVDLILEAAAVETRLVPVEELAMPEAATGATATLSGPESGSTAAPDPSAEEAEPAPKAEPAHGAEPAGGASAAVV